MEEDTCIVNATLRLARFFAHESCGKCTPCRVGTKATGEHSSRTGAARPTILTGY